MDFMQVTWKEECPFSIFVLKCIDFSGVAESLSTESLEEAWHDLLFVCFSMTFRRFI